MSKQVPREQKRYVTLTLRYLRRVCEVRVESLTKAMKGAKIKLDRINRVNSERMIKRDITCAEHLE